MTDRSVPMPFPHLEVRDLEGRRRVLPDDLPGPWDLLVLAFRRGQQADVDRWGDLVRTAGIDHLDFWEVPVIGRAWGPARGWIDGGMARAIPDREVRIHTLTTYTDVRGVLSALGVHGTGQVVAVLVVDGTARWRSVGTASQAAIAELVDRVAEIRAAGGPDGANVVA
jgi:hypothetical protein